MNETTRLILILISIMGLVMLLIIIVLHFFPSGWTCQYDSSTKLCFCGCSGACLSNEYGFNYTEDYCNNIGRVMNGTG